MELLCDMYYTDNALFLLSFVKSDIHLFDVDGLNRWDVLYTIEKLKEINPVAKLVVLIPRQTELDLLPLMSTEIDSMIEKNRTLHVWISQFIRDMLNRNHYLNPKGMTGKFISDFFDLKMRNLDIFAERLSNAGLNLIKREIEIAYLMGVGLKNREIATNLRLSEGTVKAYVSRIYKKLGCHKRGAAADMMNRIYLNDKP
ncbi:response regulator transcription factor [Lentibacillus salicampi]|nr:response regulator transcription factor [Lentibacillus salicampi]